MAKNSKRETEVVNEKIAALMAVFTQECPDWIQQLDQVMEGSGVDIPEEMEPLRTALTDFISKTCTEIKHGTAKEADLFKLFPQKFYSLIQKLVEPRLRILHAFAPLCAVYDESPSKAENIIDQIWQQYVVRFNPYRRIERPNGMTDDDMTNLEQALDAFADYCSIKALHYDAIVQRIKQEANLPSGLCDYIARRIDKDYQEIRMNYIISRLEFLKRQNDI